MKQIVAARPSRRPFEPEGAPPRRATARIVRPFVLFFLYLGAGVLVLNTGPVVRGFVDPWTRVNAAAAAAMTRAVGIGAHAVGTTVGSGAATLSILPGCNGTEALLILASSILAFPAPWSRRILGVLAGIVAILGVNFVRLASLIVIARYFPARLELFHIYVWQTLIILIAFCLFLMWANYFTLERPRTTAPDNA